MSRQDEHDRDPDRWRDLDEIDAKAAPDYSLSPIADKVNTGLMALLIGVWAGNRLFPQFGFPELATAFPYVAAFSAVVFFSAWGVDIGALPTPGADRGGGRQ